MKQDERKKKKRARLFTSLGRTLGTGFLLTALAPLTLVGALCYFQAHDSLTGATQTSLKIAAEMKTREIDAYFDNMLADLLFQSEALSNIRLLEKLIAARKASGKPLEEFVKSVEWTAIVDEFAGDFKKFRLSFNYYDAFLIGRGGDILYTAAAEKDLGANLFSDAYKNTKFSAACKKAAETGDMVFSDYEHYRPSGDRVFGFLATPVVNEEGDRIGAIALQLSITPINAIMQADSGLGRTAETYLVGPDFSLRSESVLDKEKALIGEKIRTRQTQRMEEGARDGRAKETRGRDAFAYKGLHGQPVLGIHQEFMIRDVKFAVIAEIEKEEALAQVIGLGRLMLFTWGGSFVLAVLFAFIMVRRIVTPVILLSSSAKKVTQGDYSQRIEVKARYEIGALARSFAAMVEALAENRRESRLKNWFQKGQMELNAEMSGVRDLAELSRGVITFLARYLGAEIGALYVSSQDNRLRLTGSYAFSTRKRLSNELKFGQGLVGQAALEKERILLTSAPDDYIEIRSGLGDALPREIVVKPFVRDGQVVGVIELGGLDPFSENALEFLDLVSESIAVGVQTILSHLRVQDLLNSSRTQAEKLEAGRTELLDANQKLEARTEALKKSEANLQSQQERLRQTNEELEMQTNALRQSETRLQAQQEELRQTNEELEEQARVLEEQKTKITNKNKELENTRKQIELKAKDLETAGRYKSEFLANMSHELRTPLNSILLLSMHLAENKGDNLTEKQTECADTIHSSGKELLSLINEVLDLAKVESGKMTLQPENVPLKSVAGAMERNFQPVSNDKNVAFDIRMGEGLPEVIRTDEQRLAQILKNLLSNAFKFTKKGSVTLEIRRPDPGENAPFDGPGASAMDGVDNEILFIVQDTGPGIPRDKQEVVFHAFKQADGSTSRKYGGTGLGLSISREYALLLGGNLSLSSEVGRGAVFTLRLPAAVDGQAPSEWEERAAEQIVPPGEAAADKEEEIPEAAGQEDAPPVGEYIPDDRNALTDESRSILIIEDDPTFAKILRDSAREKGFMALVAESGETGLHMTDCYAPDGIILDLGLPGMDGNSVLFRLKENFATRHIPVHIVSATDKTLEHMHMGAVGYLTKPVTMESVNRAFDRIERVISKKVKTVLVVEDNDVSRRLVTDLLGNGVAEVTAASTGAEAKALLVENDFDCMILDLGLPDMSGAELLTELRQRHDFDLPVIVHTARDLTPGERTMLDGFAESIVIKDIKSQEKLLDETTLFLHRVEADLPEEKRKMLRMIHDKEAILENKKILVVDDDMRNVFALINILEDKGVKPIVAKNGRESLLKVRENPDVDLVLMDIMMPEMDGYTAMREIRKMGSKFEKTPIIALTAKAMKGDREKCIKAGASDYLSKPVDQDKLLSMLRVWLY
ncbi:MAG: response regulator [Desulfobacterales bacterium]|nr:response regulator [Desulfobacterales bacterium]